MECLFFIHSFYMDQFGIILLHHIQKSQKFLIRSLPLLLYNRSWHCLKISLVYFAERKVKEGSQQKRKKEGPKQHIKIMQLYFDIIFH